MERRDERLDDVAAEGNLEDPVDRDHPAGPSQPDDGFAKGHTAEGDADEDVQPDYARGIDEPHAEKDAEGRFSRGAEAPGTEERSEEGRFSRGIEQLPHERK